MKVASLLKSDYEFRLGEAGIFVEIYLPDKPEFQEKLFDTLNDGFDIEIVKVHLKKRKDEIKAFLQDHYISKFTHEEIDKMSRVFKGYSIYKVDGTFYNEENKGVDKELTQVIRIMFVPDLDETSPTLSYDSKRRIIKDYLEFTGENDKFLEEYPFEKKKLSIKQKDIKEIALYISRWEAQVALFVFGYILFLMCERIKELNQKKGIKWEDEIWVTSFWNLTLNRVAKLKT